MMMITLMQDSYRIMGNIKHGDDDHALTHDSYRIMGNVKHGDDRALTHDSYRIMGTSNMMTIAH